VVVVRAPDIDECDSGERRARDALHVGGGAERHHRVVGCRDRLEHVSRVGRLLVDEQVGEHGDRGLARAVTERVASHAVSDDEDRWRGQEAVLVDPAHRSAVRVSREREVRGRGGHREFACGLHRHARLPCSARVHAWLHSR
jgi:hypothetical protein